MLVPNSKILWSLLTILINYIHGGMYVTLYAGEWLRFMIYIYITEGKP